MVASCKRGDDIAGLDLVLVLDLDGPLVRYVVLIVDHLAVFNMNQAQIGILVRLDDVHRALDLGNDRFAFRHLA